MSPKHDREAGASAEQSQGTSFRFSAKPSQRTFGPAELEKDRRRRRYDGTPYSSLLVRMTKFSHSQKARSKGQMLSVREDGERPRETVG